MVLSSPEKLELCDQLRLVIYCQHVCCAVCSHSVLFILHVVLTVVIVGGTEDQLEVVYTSPEKCTGKYSHRNVTSIITFTCASPYNGRVGTFLQRRGSFLKAGPGQNEIYGSSKNVVK